MDEKIVCNQKQGLYCGGFNLMTTLHNSVYVEHIGNNKMWTAWCLYGPELDKLEFMKNLDSHNMVDVKIPFKGNRMILKYCPQCGGDLSF